VVAPPSLDFNNPKTSNNLMWVLIIIVLSIAAMRGELTLAWFGMA
jgi:flagellar basal body-associated protein FliL